MPVREIIKIDEELCDGCGLCVPSCAEGALRLVDGKARLVRDDYCDGLGACLAECPQGAIRIMKREAADFDGEAVRRHLAEAGRRSSAGQNHDNQPIEKGCPGVRGYSFPERSADRAGAVLGGAPSELRQWPVQLRLVAPNAPYLGGADLLLAADCAAFACGDFHSRFLKGHALAIACPKLDDVDGYVEKLASMMTGGGVRGIVVLMMQVPCCSGLEQLVRLAVQMTGKQVPIRCVILSADGRVLSDLPAGA